MSSDIVYSREQSCFILGDDLMFPYVLSVPEDIELKPELYTIYGFLNKYGTVENRIYKVIERGHDEFIGYILPLLALFSNEHDWADQKFFLTFAANSYIKLIKENIGIEGISTEISIDILNKFNDNLIILILDKERISSTNFNINQYYMSLYKYGYYRVENIDEFKTYECDNNNNRVVWPDKNLKIEPICSQFADEAYILTLPKRLNNKNGILKFFYLYQVIEVIIEKILKRELKKISDNYENASSGYDLSRQIYSVVEEQERIQKLFSDEYKVGDFTKTNLRNECNTLIEMLKTTKVKSNASTALYSIRNTLVHNLRLINEDHMENLNRIIEEFEEFIQDILFNYKEGA